MRFRRRSSVRQHAFTLIEVLVVVAIIALLVAILIPSLRKARDQAKSLACKTNLHDFGNAIAQYATDHKGYYPLPSYIGSTVWSSQPDADDNLFVLWLNKYTRNVQTFTCPATPHRVRVPERIEKVPIPGKGIQYDIYTGGELRSDFELHAQVVESTVQLHGRSIKVNGFGTSYEYGGWVGSMTITKVDWYPLNKKGVPGSVKEVGGEPMKSNSFFVLPVYEGDKIVGTRRALASTFQLMKDADEGGETGRQIVGATGGGTNNLPEPWDNHGAKYSNVLFGDMHVETLGLPYWEKFIRENPTAE